MDEDRHSTNNQGHYVLGHLTGPMQLGSNGLSARHWKPEVFALAAFFAHKHFRFSVPICLHGGFQAIFSLPHPTSSIKSGIHAFGLIGLSSPNLPTGRLKCLRQLCSLLEKHFRFSASNCLHGGFQRNFQCLPTHTPNAVVKSCIWPPWVGLPSPNLPTWREKEGESGLAFATRRHQATMMSDDG